MRVGVTGWNPEDETGNHPLTSTMRWVAVDEAMHTWDLAVTGATTALAVLIPAMKLTFEALGTVPHG